MTKVRIISIVTAGVIVGLIALVAFADSSNPQYSSDIVGTKVEPFNDVSLDGQIVEVAEGDGFVVVNFFALWCADCIVEHPQLVEFNNVLKATGSGQIFSVVYGGQDVSEVKKFFSRNSTAGEVSTQDLEDTLLDWPVINRPTLTATLDVRKIPETLVLDKDLNVVFHAKGRATCSSLALATDLDPDLCFGGDQ